MQPITAFLVPQFGRDCFGGSLSSWFAIEKHFILALWSSNVPSHQREQLRCVRSHCGQALFEVLYRYYLICTIALCYKLLLLSSFQRWGNWGAKRLSNLSGVTSKRWSWDAKPGGLVTELMFSDMVLYCLSASKTKQPTGKKR